MLISEEDHKNMGRADELCNMAKVSMVKAMRRYPQPNYVAAKPAEEAGEVVRAFIHMAEGRGTQEELEAEAVQLIGLILRLVIEGDQTITNNVAKVT